MNAQVRLLLWPFCTKTCASLENQVDWHQFETEFSPLYCGHIGRHAKPIHLMADLLILKHIRNILDECVVEQ
jgi:hypothetical protein